MRQQRLQRFDEFYHSTILPDPPAVRHPSAVNKHRALAHLQATALQGHGMVTWAQSRERKAAFLSYPYASNSCTPTRATGSVHRLAHSAQCGPLHFLPNAPPLEACAPPRHNRHSQRKHTRPTLFGPQGSLCDYPVLPPRRDCRCAALTTWPTVASAALGTRERGTWITFCHARTRFTTRYGREGRSPG